MRPATERFEGKYEAVPWSGCWLWTGKLNDKGYAKLSRGGRDAGWLYGHRVSYEKHISTIPDGLHVLHRCDIPCCVNPAHLFLGTQAQNNADRDLKGRQVAPRGDKNGMAKLDEALVRLIRGSADSSISLAGRIGVDASTVRKVRRYELWSHI